MQPLSVVPDMLLTRSEFKIAHLADLLIVVPSIFQDGSILECVVWTKPQNGRSVESRKQPAVASWTNYQWCRVRKGAVSQGV